MQTTIFNAKKGIWLGILLSVHLITPLSLCASDENISASFAPKQVEQEPQKNMPCFDKKALIDELTIAIEQAWNTVENNASDCMLEDKIKHLSNLVAMSLQFNPKIEKLRGQYITIRQAQAIQEKKPALSDEKLSERFMLKLQRHCIEIIGTLIQKNYPQKSWWEGFSLIEIFAVPALCLFVGREIQNKGKLPALKNILSLETICDLGVGYSVGMFMTACHEFGHAAVYRLTHGAWPEVSIGSNYFTDKKKFSFFNGTWSLRGYNPFVGATLCTKTNARKWHDLPLLLAGGFAGIVGYYGLKTAICSIKGDKYPDFESYKKYLNQIKPNDMAWNSGTSGFLKLVDFGAYIQLANALLSAGDQGGTDAAKSVEVIAYRLQKRKLS